MLCHARLTAAALLLASASSCRAAADTAERVERFEAMLSEELGAEVELQCPTMVDQNHTYCTAVVSGEEELVFPVRVVSRGDDLDYTTKRWVSGKRMVELGKHTLEEKFDIKVDSLTCPPISHMPDGAKVRCDASAEGIDIPLEVSMVVKVRKLEFKPVGGVVFGDEAARVAHETLHEQGVHTEVSCSRPVVVSVVGKRFECNAVMPDKTVSTVHYLITDTKGSFELGTEPPTAGGSSAQGHDHDHDHDHEQEGDTPT